MWKRPFLVLTLAVVAVSTVVTVYVAVRARDVPTTAATAIVIWSCALFAIIAIQIVRVWLRADWATLRTTCPFCGHRIDDNPEKDCTH